MSTKIYNGYRLNSCSFHDLHSMVMRLFDDLDKIMGKQFLRLVGSEAAATVDSYDFHGLAHYHGEIHGEKVELKGNVIFNTANHIWNRHKEIQRTKVRDPFNDFQFEVCFFPHEKSNSILAMIFVDNKEYLKHWESLPEVEEFPYWDNADPPEEISWEEWKDRGRIWDEVLVKEPCSPSRNGCTYTLCGEVIGPVNLWDEKVREKMIEDVPTKESRAKRVVEGLLEDRFIQGKQFDAGEAFKSFSQAGAAYREFKDRMEAGEFDELHQRLYEEFLPKIRDIGMKTIYGKKEE